MQLIELTDDGDYALIAKAADAQSTPTPLRVDRTAAAPAAEIDGLTVTATCEPKAEFELWWGVADRPAAPVAGGQADDNGQVTINLGDVQLTGWVATAYNTSNFTQQAYVEAWPKIDRHFEGGAPDPRLSADDFSYVFEGYIDLAAPDMYTFELNSDDGSRLFIDDDLLLNYWGRHEMTPRQTRVYLPAGLHRIRISYQELDGWAGVQFRAGASNTGLTLDIPIRRHTGPGGPAPILRRPGRPPRQPQRFRPRRTRRLKQPGLRPPSGRPASARRRTNRPPLRGDYRGVNALVHRHPTAPAPTTCGTGLQPVRQQRPAAQSRSRTKQPRPRATALEQCSSRLAGLTTTANHHRPLRVSPTHPATRYNPPHNRATRGILLRHRRAPGGYSKCGTMESAKPFAGAANNQTGVRQMNATRATSREPAIGRASARAWTAVAAGSVALVCGACAGDGRRSGVVAHQRTTARWTVTDVAAHTLPTDAAILGPLAPLSDPNELAFALYEPPACCMEL